MTIMTINKEFEQTVLQQDTLGVRIMLKNSLIVDPTHVEFQQMLTYAEARLDSLYDDHDGEILRHSPTMWTKDYMDDQMVKAVYNFSKERVSLLKNICKHLYGSRVSRPQTGGPATRTTPAAPTARSHTSGTFRQETNRSRSGGGTYVPRPPQYHDNRMKKQIGASLAVVGIVSIIVGAVIPKAAIIAAGVAMTAIGGIIIATDKPRRYL